jgi:hypothetical protein
VKGSSDASSASFNQAWRRPHDGDAGPRAGR